MKIGVMSDTHLRLPDPTLEYIMDELLAGMDMILHAGDIVTLAVLEYLRDRGVIAVSGNMDEFNVTGHLPHVREINAGDKRIGLIHGWGAREGLERRIIERFSVPPPDVIVYGHSHVPFWGKVDGVWMFNPGSATARGYRGAGTVGVIDIAGDIIEGKHFRVER
ncbi:MAG: metallophosphatase family protein [Desulfomonile sp.]|nr:metallophosphatase family protein [Desulfomonile sp.]